MLYFGNHTGGPLVRELAAGPGRSVLRPGLWWMWDGEQAWWITSTGLKHSRSYILPEHSVVREWQRVELDDLQDYLSMDVGL